MSLIRWTVGTAGGGAAGQVQVRSPAAGEWPVRGTVPTGTIVLWIKRDADDPDPSIDATYMLAGTDILLKATA